MRVKSAVDTIRFATQKVIRMATVPLIRIYKPNIDLFTKYHHMKATLYTHPLYGKVPSLLGNKLAQVFIYGEFIFIINMKSDSDGEIGLTDLCYDNGIPE